MIAEPDDEGLVRQARAGDRSAFERLYERHAGRVFGICMRLTGNAAEAEDMAQEAFIRAWQRLATFEGRAPFSAWMRRLTINVVLNERRARGRAPAWEALGDDPVVDPRPVPQSNAGVRTDLERSITELPEAARFVFVLHDVYGHTHEEISGIAGIAVGTSKAHLHRARRLLRKALGS